MDQEKFKALLDDQHEFPCDYSFKFIVKSHKVTELKSLVGEAQFRERPSKAGTYLGVTVTKTVTSSDHVLEIYSKVSVVEGLMSM